ncbi:MAG: PmoA family protein [Planctomycetaceae bacterium]|nr:PmoA family protein [Planctomycetaceae bacterium]
MRYTFAVSAGLCCLLAVSGVRAAEPLPFVTNINEAEKLLTVAEGDLPVLTYHYDMTELRSVAEKSARKFAGCYVHPLYGLNGEILTDNAPRDHYHHHGIFWTWPHVGVHYPDGRVVEYDLWQGTKYPALKQRFIRWIEQKNGDAAVSFEAENGWFVQTGSAATPAEGEKIMDERVRVVIRRIESVDGIRSRAVDFDFVWKPAAVPVSLRGSEGKSYGGFTFRFKPFLAEGKKQADNSETNIITVPDGVAEKDLPDTPLSWADYTSLFDGRKTLSGAAVFVPKSHPDFPPTWLTRYYGPLCVGYPGVKERLYKPGEELHLQYRVWIHDGKVTPAQLKKVYDRFAQ